MMKLPIHVAFALLIVELLHGLTGAAAAKGLLLLLQSHLTPLNEVIDKNGPEFGDKDS